MFTNSMRKINSLLIQTSVLAWVMLLTNTHFVSAQSSKQEICEGSGGTWNAADGLCEQGSGSDLFGSGSVFQNIANILTFLVGALAVVMLIVGGIRYVVSGGSPEATKGAKDTIMYAIIGIVVAFMAYAIVNWITTSL